MTTQTPIELVEQAINKTKNDLNKVEKAIHDFNNNPATHYMDEDYEVFCNVRNTIKKSLKHLTLIRDALKDAEKEIRRMPARTPQIPIWIKREEVLKALGCGEKDV